jgi:hypothetical protein
MVASQPSIGVECFQQFESCSWPMHHRRGDAVIERHHRIVRHLPQQAIQGEDLRPVGIIGSGGFVVDCGNRGLKLLRTNRGSEANGPPISAGGGSHVTFRDPLPSYRWRGGAT